MARQGRRWLFFVAAAALAWTFALAYLPVAKSGAVESHYGNLVNLVSFTERRITDSVTAVNFDIRGFDTLGEEFILFTSVIGTLLLMRRQQDEPAGDHEDRAPGRTVPPASDAVRVVSLALVPVALLFGFYIVTHGQITPGGGFQGGVVLASAPLLLYLCAEYRQLQAAVSRRFVGISECSGAAAYILIGGIGVAVGGAFLQNTLPVGQSVSVTSGGMVPLIDLGVGIEVGGGISLVLLAYLEELVEEKDE